jgi:beta-lactam-binding protein with PASTA domain
MILFVILIFAGVLLWLKFYTNHGQKLEMPQFEGVALKAATKDADKKSFEIIVNDSIHRVGMPGGMILSQNPKAGSLVKENRKIYVDITKYNADIIMLDDLRQMYGREYNSKKQELASLLINSEIRGRRYDPGEANHILEVYYGDQLIEGRGGRSKDIKIEKGATLSFIVSGVDGGEIALYDFKCQILSQVRSRLEMSRLKIGNIERSGVVTDLENAYIVSQDPAYEEGLKLPMGSMINVVVKQDKPTDCR